MNEDITAPPVSPYSTGIALPWREGMAPRYLCRVEGVTALVTVDLATVAVAVERGTEVTVLARWDV